MVEFIAFSQKPIDVSIIGGGIAGAVTGISLQQQNRAANTRLYEQRPLMNPRNERGKFPDNVVKDGFHKCNGCGGVLITEAVEMLRSLGIEINENSPFVQSHITNIVYHFPGESQTFSIPIDSYTVFRNDAPLLQKGLPTMSFDRILLQHANRSGVSIVEAAIQSIDFGQQQTGKIILTETNQQTHAADMVILSSGHATRNIRMNLAPGMKSISFPKTRPALVREYFFGDLSMKAHTKSGEIKNSMHVFASPTSFFMFVAVIDKGEYVSIVAMPKKTTDPIKLNEEYKKLLRNQQFQELVGDLSRSPPCCNCNTNTITVEPSKNYMIVDQYGKVVAIALGDAQGGREYKNGIGSAILQAITFAEIFSKNGNTLRGLQTYQDFIRDNYLSDAAWANLFIQLSITSAENPLIRKLIIELIVRQIPFIAPGLLGIFDHMATGKIPYKNIPWDIINQVLNNPFLFRDKPISDFITRASTTP